MNQRETRAKLLDLQAQLERNLAAKQDNPVVRRLIANSAIGKAELAHELRSGQPVEHSQYERREEVSHPFKVKWTVR